MGRGVSLAVAAAISGRQRPFWRRWLLVSQSGADEACLVVRTGAAGPAAGARALREQCGGRGRLLAASPSPPLPSLRARGRVHPWPRWGVPPPCPTGVTCRWDRWSGAAIPVAPAGAVARGPMSCAGGRPLRPQCGLVHATLASTQTTSSTASWDMTDCLCPSMQYPCTGRGSQKIQQGYAP